MDDAAPAEDTLPIMSMRVVYLEDRRWYPGYAVVAKSAAQRDAEYRMIMHDQSTEFLHKTWFQVGAAAVAVATVGGFLTSLWIAIH